MSAQACNTFVVVLVRCQRRPQCLFRTKAAIRHRRHIVSAFEWIATMLPTGKLHIEQTVWRTRSAVSLFPLAEMVVETMIVLSRNVCG